jgi:F-box interacting protein
MSEYVPDEVVVDILQRLPVKSLIRFRCVSKSWNSLITSPAFVHSHLNQSIPNNNNLPHPLLIVRHCSSSANRALDKEHYKLFYDNEAFEECAEFDFPTKSRSLKHFRLIASENGLICLSEQERYVLWNPSIRKCWNLPKPCITARKHSGSTCHEAFGFDPRTNDHKVVRIVIHHSTKKAPVEEAPVEEAPVEVYSVRTCSWRLSSASLTPSTNFTDWRKPKACLKGSVHFAALGQRNGTGIGFVLSFDLRDEVFREMIFPHNMTRLHTDIVTCVFSGSLALLCYDEKRFSCSIWVMKEYGVVDSWVKQFPIDIARGIEKNVLGFRKNGHIILEIMKEVNYWELFSYDPLCQQATKLEIQKNMHTFCVDTYRENLVLLNQANVVSRRRMTKKRKNR